MKTILKQLQRPDIKTGDLFLSNYYLSEIEQLYIQQGKEYVVVTWHREQSSDRQIHDLDGYLENNLKVS